MENWAALHLLHSEYINGIVLFTVTFCPFSIPGETEEESGVARLRRPIRGAIGCIIFINVIWYCRGKCSCPIISLEIEIHTSWQHAKYKDSIKHQTKGDISLYCQYHRTYPSLHSWIKWCTDPSSWFIFKELVNSSHPMCKTLKCYSK